jgi:hypothetical protein
MWHSSFLIVENEQTTPTESTALKGAANLDAARLDACS